MQSLLDCSQAQVQCGILHKERFDLAALFFDLRLLFLDGVDKHYRHAIIFNAFDFTFVIVRDEQGFDLRDFLGLQISAALHLDRHS